MQQSAGSLAIFKLSSNLFVFFFALRSLCFCHAQVDHMMLYVLLVWCESFYWIVEPSLCTYLLIPGTTSKTVIYHLNKLIKRTQLARKVPM